MRELFLVGRILVGFYYLYNGVNQFSRLDVLGQMVAARGVPAPHVAVTLSGLLLLIAGVTLLLGVLPRVGIAAVVLFLVPVTLIMHPFWNAEGMARMGELVNFTKNLALLGSSLMFFAIPEPWPYSLGSRVHARRPVVPAPA
jgi:putative oxidoreductase